ncbi:MAG: hypothetical protein DVB31_04325 [Verrucomicrobia bacterium]|nr:MAG: hypothetical protein DVB31_04325 [Verrucomicrobiota bacterium]
MQLTPAQAEVARKWIEDGAKLSEFQRKLEGEFGIKLTYMETRILVDDLKVVPKDPEPVKAPEPVVPATVVPADAAPLDGPLAEPAPAGGVQVSVVVDAITRPGAIASGSVKFSDGQTAQWYLDQTGRFGMVPPQKGYRPSEADLQQFQVILDRELQKLGI